MMFQPSQYLDTQEAKRELVNDFTRRTMAYTNATIRMQSIN
jgi:hypothetical protein